MSDSPSREEMQAAIRAEVSSLKWQIWALAAVVASPKLGGPSAPEVTVAVLDLLQDSARAAFRP